MDKIVFLQGGLYTAIAFFTPVAAFLGTDTPLTTRSLFAVGVGAVVAGCTALKAYLSTSSQQGARPAVMDQPEPATAENWNTQ